MWNNVERGVRAWCAWWAAITSKRWFSLMDVSVWSNLERGVRVVRGGRQSLPRDGQVDGRFSVE